MKGETMKFVVLKQKVEPDYSLERKVMDAESRNACIRKCLHGIDLSKKRIATYEGNEQIRIPEQIFKQLKAEVQSILRKISIKPKQSGLGNRDERWLNENYWTYCKAYIFNFDGIKLSIGVEWGYEGEESHEYQLFIIEMKHPVVADLLGCSENRWGEFGEKDNIKKWLK